MTRDMHVTTDQRFSQARTQNGYLDQPVSDDTLRQRYEPMKWGPTAADSGPGKVFARNPRPTFDEACRLA